MEDPKAIFVSNEATCKWETAISNAWVRHERAWQTQKCLIHKEAEGTRQSPCLSQDEEDFTFDRQETTDHCIYCLSDATLQNTS